MNTTTNRSWLDEMIVELRLRDVRGDAIGDAVAQVESYCAESGQSAAEAFGDPREYAGNLQFNERQVEHTTPRQWLAVLVPVALGMFAVNLASATARAARHHDPVTISWGTLASLAVLLVVSVALVTFLRQVVQRLVVGTLFLAVCFVALVAVQVAWSTPARHVPVWLGALATVLLLAVTVAGQRRGRLHDGDPLVDPRRPQAPAPVLSAATDWVFPVAAVLLAALAWFTAR